MRHYGALIGQPWGEIGRGLKAALRERTTFVLWGTENKLSKENRREDSEK